MSSTIQNARAIQAALQRLQGPAARGKLLAKATGADIDLSPGTCASPQDAGSLDRGGTVFVRPNPANAAEDSGERTWTVTSSGVLVDVEAVSGGLLSNKDGGTTYLWDPPIAGLELEAVSDSNGVTGGDYAGVIGGLRQFSHLRAIDFDPGQGLFESVTFDLPAAVLAFYGTQPQDGPMAGTPGPRTARIGKGRMLYRNTWYLYLATSRFDSMTDRSQEADLLRDDVLEVLTWAAAVRERAFRVSVEPGAEIRDSRPFRVTPSVYVDLVTIDTLTVLTRNPEPREYNDWVRTRMKLYTKQNPGSPPSPPLQIPNVVFPMPPSSGGTPPFPDEPPPNT